MMAGSDPGHYGQLEMFVTPRDNPSNGPAIVAAQIDATPKVSQQITLLNSNGSSALLGNVLMIPVADSLLYIQPLYVQSSRNAFPELQQVIAVYGKQVGASTARCDSALADVFNAPVSTTPGGTGSTGAISPQVAIAAERRPDPVPAVPADLKAGNLGAYQTDINNLESDLRAGPAADRWHGRRRPPPRRPRPLRRAEGSPGPAGLGRTVGMRPSRPPWRGRRPPRWTAVDEVVVWSPTTRGGAVW